MRERKVSIVRWWFQQGAVIGPLAGFYILSRMIPGVCVVRNVSFVTFIKRRCFTALASGGFQCGAQDPSLERKAELVIKARHYGSRRTRFNSSLFRILWFTATAAFVTLPQSLHIPMGFSFPTVKWGWGSRNVSIRPPSFFIYSLRSGTVFYYAFVRCLAL